MARRATKAFTTDGGGDTGYSDADDVTGDKVLEQAENTYDAAGNALVITTRRRFHDEAGTGELGTASSGVKARVSYVGMYYDKADRLTDEVDVGTNAGSAWTRPSSVPSRSDTVLVKSEAYNAAGWVETTTDPRGIVSKRFYDALGRTTKTIEAYVDGTVSDTDDKTVEYTYDGSGHTLTVKALLTGGGYQKTEWVYGVTTSTSDIASNDILSAMKYPDKSTGDPSSSEQETYTVNRLGQVKTKADRNGSVHTYSFDVVGRPTTDAVTTLGSGVDGAIRRVETAYDTAGRAYLFTSYDASSGGNVVNQVQREFNGLGQMTKEYQAVGGAVNTGTTPYVGYSYSEMASAANHSRLTSMTYPNGKVLTYNYASGLDSAISRLSSLSDSSGTLESYDYLGLSTVVRRAHPQTGVDLTYIKQTGEGNGDAGDPYAGLDRFGRVVDQRWIKTSDGLHTDRFKYGYDRNNNRLYEENALNSLLSELYHANGAANGYDLLNQLAEFRVGALSDANSDGVPDTVTTASRSQSWDFDALGNFDSLTTDGTAQTRTHNKQNQITGISGLTTPAYDANGNTTTDEQGRTLRYDAWNRLVEVKHGSTVLSSHAHDALNRRVTEGGRTLYYSAKWQVVEERESGVAVVQAVFSPVYVDAIVLRDRDTDANGSLDERLWAQQDANWNVTTLVNGSGAVVERFAYDPLGTPTVLTGAWVVRTTTQFAWVVRHQGGRRSEATGMYDFRNRWLLPSQGRWNRPDRLGFKAGDTNLYRYVHNQPTQVVDPSGDIAIFMDRLNYQKKHGSIISQLAAIYCDRPSNIHYYTPDYDLLLQRSVNLQVIVMDAYLKILAARALNPDEPIDIFGYSMGGVGAIALTNMLASLGISVRYLGLIDASHGTLGNEGASFNQLVRGNLPPNIFVHDQFRDWPNSPVGDRRFGVPYPRPGTLPKGCKCTRYSLSHKEMATWWKVGSDMYNEAQGQGVPWAKDNPFHRPKGWTPVILTSAELLLLSARSSYTGDGWFPR